MGEGEGGMKARWGPLGPGRHDHRVKAASKGQRQYSEAPMIYLYIYPPTHFSLPYCIQLCDPHSALLYECESTVEQPLEAA